MYTIELVVFAEMEYGDNPLFICKDFVEMTEMVKFFTEHKYTVSIAEYEE